MRRLGDKASQSKSSNYSKDYADSAHNPKDYINMAGVV